MICEKSESCLFDANEQCLACCLIPQSQKSCRCLTLSASSAMPLILRKKIVVTPDSRQQLYHKITNAYCDFSNSGATKYSYTGFVRDIKLWMDLTQYAGAKPIFSHVVNEDTTRYVTRLAW